MIKLRRIGSHIPNDPLWITFQKLKDRHFLNHVYIGQRHILVPARNAHTCREVEMVDERGGQIPYVVPEVTATLLTPDRRLKGALVDLLYYYRRLAERERRLMTILLDRKVCMPKMLDPTGSGRMNLFMGEAEALLPYLGEAQPPERALTDPE